MQFDVYTDLADSPRQALEKMGTDNMPLSVTKQAETIKTKYTELISKYAKVHNSINHGRRMSDEDLDEAGKYFSNY